MSEPRWVSAGAVLAIHAALIEEHGGMAGLRDAAYGFGLSRNHPFHDGNKRVSLAIVDVFLQLNGWELVASEAEATVAFRDLAAGRLDEEALARWIREHSKKRQD